MTSKILFFFFKFKLTILNTVQLLREAKAASDKVATSGEVSMTGTSWLLLIALGLGSWKALFSSSSL